MDRSGCVLVAWTKDIKPFLSKLVVEIHEKGSKELCLYRLVVKEVEKPEVRHWETGRSECSLNVVHDGSCVCLFISA
jgi:hypothetical protein